MNNSWELHSKDNISLLFHRKWNLNKINNKSNLSKVLLKLNLTRWSNKTLNKVLNKIVKLFKKNLLRSPCLHPKNNKLRFLKLWKKDRRPPPHLLTTIQQKEAQE